jgi:cysteine desulfurase
VAEERERGGHVTNSTSVYLDHAATTPMLPEVLAAMTEQLGRVGNASSLHASGRAARRSAEQARERLAEALGARPSEVLFTGGGTESDNLAVKGLFWARRQADSRRRRIVVSPAEHHAVLDSVEWLAKHDGADVTWLPVGPTGRVTPEALAEALGDGTDVAVASVMWANNEIGTVCDIAALAEVAHAVGVPLHTDAVQAVGQVPVDFGASGVDALTMTGHKLGGPMGAGVLLLRRDAECTPLLHGGGQERDVRSGTLDVAAIAGLAVAAVTSVATRAERAARVARLRDRLVTGVVAQVPDAQLNGPPLDDVLAGGPGRLPGNAHLSFPGAEGDALLMLLDARGIECSTGSACSAGVARPSHVLLAVGADAARARSSLRFSLGHTSIEADVDAVLEVIGPVVERGRRAGMGRRS